jgi:hypothetical protein
VRISAEEVHDYALENDMQLLALEGVRTQYMWTTMRKRSPGWRGQAPKGHTGRIRRITNAQNSEPVVPVRGRFASFTVWLEQFPPDCDLIGLEVRVGNHRATPTYIGPPEADTLQQLNVVLGDVERTGLIPLDILWNGDSICTPSTLRVIPPGPFVPHIWAVSDGVNVMSGKAILSGTVKVTIEETDRPDQFTAEMGGRPVSGLDIFCVDPSLPRYEINFDVPRDLPPGPHELRMRLGERALGSVLLHVGAGGG